MHLTRENLEKLVTILISTSTMPVLHHGANIKCHEIGLAGSRNWVKGQGSYSLRSRFLKCQGKHVQSDVLTHFM
jgi:hypothetical protein